MYVIYIYIYAICISLVLPFGNETWQWTLSFGSLMLFPVNYKPPFWMGMYQHSTFEEASKAMGWWSIHQTINCSGQRQYERMDCFNRISPGHHVFLILDTGTCCRFSLQPILGEGVQQRLIFNHQTYLLWITGAGYWAKTDPSTRCCRQFPMWNQKQDIARQVLIHQS